MKYLHKTRVILPYINKAKKENQQKKEDSYTTNLKISTLITTIPFQLIVS